jgi:hypothetical protein
MSLPGEKRPSARYVLPAVIALAVCALAWLLFVSMSRRTPAIAGPMASGDPVAGTPVALPTKDIADSPVLAGGDKPILLVALPACTGCTQDNFEPDKINLGRYGKVFLLSRGRVFLNQIAKKHPNESWVYLPDNDDKFANRINAVFKPRGYVLTPDFKIKAVQPPLQKLTDFANNVDL